MKGYSFRSLTDLVLKIFKTKVNAGTGLSGGGSLEADRTLTVNYGTTAGTATQGNDSRVVNAASNATVNAKEAALEAKKADKAITITAGTGLSGGGTLAANRTLDVSYGTGAGTAAQGNDSRLSNSREWTGETISQAEAEAGTATTRRAFTAQRVRQAIVAWFSIFQTTGTSTDFPMSQKATTDLLATKANTSTQVIAGTGLTGGGNLSANRTLAVSYGTAAGTAAQGNDSRLSDSREWTAVTITQAEAEAGSAVTRRAFTAQRVRQAIVAWWNSITGTFGRDLVTSSDSTAARSKLGLGTSALRWPTWAEVTAKPIVQTVGSSTTNIMSQKAVTDTIRYTEDHVGQPFMTSNAVLNRTDNSIIATGIVSKLGLEVGDVIEVDDDNLRSGFLEPNGPIVGSIYQFATNGNDVYAVSDGINIIMKQTNGEGPFKKIEGVPAWRWTGICFIGKQMYAAHFPGLIYSVDETTGAVEAVSPTNQHWQDLTTDGTHIYGCLDSSGIIVKVDPITKTQDYYAMPPSPHPYVAGLVYSPIDNSLYIGAWGTNPIRKLVNMTGQWIDVSTEKRAWSNASYYNGKVYFSDHVGQVWKENDAGDDFELFSKKPLGSPDNEGGNLIFNDILYKTQLGGVIYTTSIVKKGLFTVESIVSDDKIIVNYAHAFGAGSKSLWSQTLSAAKFKRISKWYNAPAGLGQAWVNVTSSRSASGTYYNTTNRQIDVCVSTQISAGVLEFKVNGLRVSTITEGAASNQSFGSIGVPTGSYYSTDMPPISWVEKR